MEESIFERSTTERVVILVTVPLGLILNKVVKLGPLPVKLGLAGQYMVHHPDTFGQKWNIQSEAHQGQLDKIKE
jgi:hypothetical protein